MPLLKASAALALVNESVDPKLIKQYLDAIGILITQTATRGVRTYPLGQNRSKLPEKSLNIAERQRLSSSLKMAGYTVTMDAHFNINRIEW